MQRTSTLAALLAAPLAALVLAGCATTPAPASVADTLAADPSLSTLAGLVDQAGLKPLLQGPGPYTVFAPNNEAFQAVPAKTLAELSADPALLKSVLGYHVVPGKLGAAELKNGPLKTSQGANLAVARAGGFVTVEDGMVQQADRAATNGVVHVVDRVLMPPRR